MNINQLRFVRALSRLSSFSRAAQECNVTQPTLSNGLAQLEQELGGPLFERTTRTVSLTAFGRHLLPSIERTLSDVEEIHTQAHTWHSPDHKLLRIGLSPVVNMNYLVGKLADYQQQHADVSLFYKECFLGDLTQRLYDRELEIALLPQGEVPPNVNSIVLYAEPLLYLPRHGGPLVNNEHAVNLQEIASDSLILTVDACGLRTVTMRLFSEYGLDINEYPGQATHYTAVEQWASLGIGGGILPQSKISSDNRSARPLLVGQDEIATLTITMLWKSEVPSGLYFSDVINSLVGNA